MNRKKIWILFIKKRVGTFYRKLDRIAFRQFIASKCSFLEVFSSHTSVNDLEFSPANSAIRKYARNLNVLSGVFIVSEVKLIPCQSESRVLLTRRRCGVIELT